MSTRTAVSARVTAAPNPNTDRGTAAASASGMPLLELPHISMTSYDASIFGGVWIRYCR